MKRIAILGALALLLASTPVTLAAGTDQQWSVTLASGGVSGKATLTLPVDGRSATAILWLNRLRTGTKVTAELRSGACAGTGTLIAGFPSFTTTLGGTWRDRLIMTRGALSMLKSALSKEQTLSVRTVVGGRRICVDLAKAP